MDSAFIQARLDNCKQLILDYEAVLLELAQNPNASYTINTGQTTTTVTKRSVGKINELLQSLYSHCELLESRLNGGEGYVIPK